VWQVEQWTEEDVISWISDPKMGLAEVAVCCSVLQCVAVCCSVLQCGAVCCSVLQCVAVFAVDRGRRRFLDVRP